jgi:hypothetical protein
MLAPKRRQPLAQVLSRDPCATVAIDGPSPAAGGLRSSLLQGEQCGNGILYAACNLFQYIDKADDFLHHLSAARTFAGRLPNVWAI